MALRHRENGEIVKSCHGWAIDWWKIVIGAMKDGSFGPHLLAASRQIANRSISLQEDRIARKKTQPRLGRTAESTGRCYRWKRRVLMDTPVLMILNLVNS